MELSLPGHCDILTMGTPSVLANPEAQIQAALGVSIGSPGLDAIIETSLARHRDAKAVVVISDNTRPVPYKGPSGILWPIVARLMAAGVGASRITVLVATGMHRGLRPTEIEEMLDARVIEAGVTIANHDGKDAQSLSYLGKTKRGGEIYINSLYANAGIKILTGLVESHFMAGVSGGRKSICPGIVGEKSTFVFHGAPMMANANATDLQLAGNPCHEEAIEVASIAGADYIVNVTLNHDFELTGVFAGDLIEAHEAAAKHLKTYSTVPYQAEYDVVLTHAGFVGINHYQAAKAGTAAARLVKPGGHVLMLADNTDTDPIGSLAYKTVLQLLTLNGPEAVETLLQSSDWTFIPEQWQVQMWNRLFRKIPTNHFHYYSAQFGPDHYDLTPGNPLAALAGQVPPEPSDENIADMIVEALDKLQSDSGTSEPLSIAYLRDGPYGIPVRSNELSTR